jgi:NitT/TauT family transport system substrate-binding protein
VLHKYLYNYFFKEDFIMKKVLSTLLAAAMVTSLAACGGTETAATTAAATTTAAPAATEAPAEKAPETEAPAETEAAKDPITLKVAYMPNYGSLWSVTTAINKGYMEEEGITIEMVEFQDGPTIIAAMESGSIDMGYIGQGAHKLCINGQAKIFALSHISNGDAVIGGPNVKTLEDLKGKKVAYSSGTSSEDILKMGLDSAGMTMEDIEAVDMDASGIVTAMMSGGVDACATWSPNSLKILEDTNNTKLCDNLTFSDTSVSLASWIVTPSYAEANQDKILRFAKALYKGMDYAADGQYEEVAQYVADQTKTDYDSVYAQRGDAEWLTGKEVAEGAKDGTVEGYYKIQQENMIASGAVEAEVPVADYVLLDLMAEAGN